MGIRAAICHSILGFISDSVTLELMIVNQWVPGGSPSPSPLPPLTPVPVVFSGERSEFFRLAARGAALEFITLGFYRFWLATDMRRHLWANTEVDCDATEYTGRGKELLVGFLFALAILVPVYLAYFLIGLEVERLKAFASLLLFVFFYLFGQFAIYRGATLPPDAYSLARRPVLDGRFGVGLCSASGLMDPAHDSDARPDPAMAGGSA
jgi:hypothetical protein